MMRNKSNKKKLNKTYLLERCIGKKSPERNKRHWRLKEQEEQRLLLLCTKSKI